MSRGSGKTSLCQAAVIWALLYGHRQFVALVASDQAAACMLLDDIKAELETNELLGEDFPEVCIPVRRLEGILNRAPGQLHHGQRTRITWTANEVVLPTIAGSVASGGRVRVYGMTGRIRGAKATAPDGSTIRPDLAIIDDPQTDESARSASQTQRRIDTLNGAVLGLAGPNKKIAAVMPCTVIAPDDVAEQLLDQSKHPEWLGHRAQMVYDWPSNQKLWDQYAEIRADSLRIHGDIRDATRFYEDNRDDMDDGSRVGWPERYRPDEISALQHAFNLKLRDEISFASEYQNEPLDLASVDADILTVAEVSEQITGLKRGVVPTACTKLVAFIDVQKKALYYVVAAFDEQFGGSVIEYGTYPDQRASYFSLADLSKTLQRAHPGMTLEGQLFAGMKSCCNSILGRGWYREDGVELRVSRCCIDANWGDSTEIVKKFCRESDHAAVLLPSFGRGITADRKPINEYIRHPGDRFGWNWYCPAKGNQRHILYDVFSWKSFVSQRLKMTWGDTGAFAIYQAAPKAHRLFAEHLCSEYPTMTSGLGRSVNVWKLRPNRDNHWWDCLVGCFVAASEQGIVTASHENVTDKPQPKRKRRRLQVSF